MTRLKPIAGGRSKQAPVSPKILLDPKDPMDTARKFIHFAHTATGGIRTLHRWRDDFYTFDHTHYRLSPESEVRALIWAFLETASRVNARGEAAGPFKPTKAIVSDVMDALAAVTLIEPHVDAPRWLEPDGDLPKPDEFFPTKNGLLHIPTRELWPATPSYFSTNATSVIFDPDAPAPTKWLTFLDEVCNGDFESIQLLSEWFGYALTLDTRLQKILLLVGPPRCGKGTIARVQQHLLGSSNVAAPTLPAMSKGFGLAPLIGKKLAIIGDVRLGKQADQAAIVERLLSISGEDTLTIDRKFREPWTGQLRTRFMLLTNEVPKLQDASTALAKRFAVLTFRRTFYGREDPHLLDKLLGEMPGILNWALEGYTRLYERGAFTRPAASQETIDHIEALASPVHAFIRDRCEIGTNYQVLKDALYANYRAWCEGEGARPETKAAFAAELLAADGRVRGYRPRSGASRQQMYAGIRLRC